MSLSVQISARLLIMRTSFYILSLSGLLAVCFASAVNVSVPLFSPSNAQPLSQTLLSFSIEQDRWPDWSGVTSRNEFTHSALQNYAALTGQPPKLRVGADSEDNTYWAASVRILEESFPSPNTVTPYPEATRIIVGDEFYTLSRFLPRGTRMVWGVNFGANNVSNAVNMARSIIRGFENSAVVDSGVVLDRIEIGNEADIYNYTGHREGDWTAEDYVSQWTALAGSVVEAVGIRGRSGLVTLQGAAFVIPVFPVAQIFDLGILDSEAGKAISVISQHHYSAFFCDGGDFPGPLTSFINKAAIRSNLTIFESDIAATKAKGLIYVLGETSSIACHGAPGVSNTAGAALWTIDYTLQAATLGISEAYFHEGVGYRYNFFQPVSLNRSIIDGSALDHPQPPRIMPSYYAGLVIGTFVGKSGASEIVELTIDDDNVSGYAAFEDGQLARAVFINLDGWLSTSTGTRPFVHIDLFFAGAGIGKGPRGTAKAMLECATATRLLLEHADDTAGLRWAGQSFETSNALPKGKVVQERVVLSRGLDLPASEAVLLVF